MKIRCFNKTGLAQFNEFLASSGNPPLLDSDITSRVVAPQVEIKKRLFSSRFEIGEYLNKIFESTQIPNIAYDKYLWSWLALFYFEQLCPNGKPGEFARMCLNPDKWNKYYRHLLAGPYRIYRMHRKSPELTRVLLLNPPHQPGDIYEQLASRQQMATNRTLLKVATALYLDAQNKHKRGAAGKGAGSARRLADVWNQFDLTWDLYYMDSGEILDMLPAEFEKFKT